MSVSDELINRLSTETGLRLLERARAGRLRALRCISKCCVVVTDDGFESREVVFAEPPTLAQLAERVGADVFVVSVKMQRVGRRQRQALKLAAE